MSTFLRTASRALARPSTTSTAAARTFSTTTPCPVARITIVGNLADSPELRPSSTGREYLRYAVASNSGFGEGRKTSWFNVNCFVQEGPQRDFLQALPKGTTVMVQGEVSINNYEDAEGKPRQGLNIKHQSLDVLRRPFNPNASEGGQEQQ